MKDLSCPPSESGATGTGRNQRSTIYDVAKEAGVSIATVSRFINNTENVRNTTGSRVAAAMERLDFVPQGNTGSRSQHAVGRIGVLTPFYPASSFVPRWEGLIPVLRRNNFEAVVYTIDGPAQLDEYLTSVPFTRRIDGLILMSVRLTDEQRRILDASGTPVVIVETDDDKYSRVLADNEQGGAIAAQLFIEKNYFPCVYLADDGARDFSYSLHPSDARLKGFRDALGEAGIRLPGSGILESKTTVGSGNQVFEDYLKGNSLPRGVFAMSDVQAIGVLKSARQRGVQVPGEMAILGFDDIEAADWMDLSSITQHLGESGRIAAELLLSQISGESRIVQQINLKVRLVERSTT